MIDRFISQEMIDQGTALDEIERLYPDLMQDPVSALFLMKKMNGQMQAQVNALYLLNRWLLLIDLLFHSSADQLKQGTQRCARASQGAVAGLYPATGRVFSNLLFNVRSD